MRWGWYRYSANDGAAGNTSLVPKPTIRHPPPYRIKNGKEGIDTWIDYIDYRHWVLAIGNEWPYFEGCDSLTHSAPYRTVSWSCRGVVNEYVFKIWFQANFLLRWTWVKREIIPSLHPSKKTGCIDSTNKSTNHSIGWGAESSRCRSCSSFTLDLGKQGKWIQRIVAGS